MARAKHGPRLDGQRDQAADGAARRTCGFTTETKTGPRHSGTRRPSAARRARPVRAGGQLRSGHRSISACCMLCASLASRCGTMRAPSSAASTNPPPLSCCIRPGCRRPGPGPGPTSEAAIAVAATMLAKGSRLVQKPLFGAQGEGLRLITAPDEIAPPEAVNGAYYLQEFVAPADSPHRDWRIFISAGRVVAAMIRHGSSWITNIKQGARAEAAIPSQELVDLALRASACVGADYAGVDIMQDRSGAYLVLEVNSMPAWQGLQRVTRTRIADQHRCPVSRCRARAVACPRARGRLSRPLASAADCPSLP